MATLYAKRDSGDYRMQVIASTRPNRPTLTNADIIRVNGAYIFADEFVKMCTLYEDKPIFIDVPTKREKVKISNISLEDIQYILSSKNKSNKDIKNIVAFSKVESEDELYLSDHFLTCAKIESIAGVLNIKNIAKASDVICIDRMDLISYIKDIKEYFAYEDLIIKDTKEAGKQIFIASDILPSLIQGKQPTLPEMIQLKYYRDKGVDGIILAEETAVGFYPYHAIDTIHSINKRKLEINCE